MRKEFEIWLDLKVKLVSHQLDLRHYTRVRSMMFEQYFDDSLPDTATVTAEMVVEQRQATALIDFLERQIYKLKEAINFVNNPGWLLRYYKDVHNAQRTVSQLLGMQVDVQSTILFPQQGEDMRVLYEAAKRDYFNTLKQLND